MNAVPPTPTWPNPGKEMCAAPIQNPSFAASAKNDLRVASASAPFVSYSTETEGSLNGGDVNDVAPNQQLLPATLDRICRMARGVPRRRYRPNPRDKFRIAVKGLEPASVNVRFQRGFIALEHRP
jgi:hypothetical protein